MNEDDNFGFAAPPFSADAALQRLKRDLRELGLVERAAVFERRGVAIAKACIDGAALRAAVVKRPSRSSPEWSAKTLNSAADARNFVADLKRKLAGWSERDDG